MDYIIEELATDLYGVYRVYDGAMRFFEDVVPPIENDAEIFSWTARGLQKNKHWLQYEKLLELSEYFCRDTLPDFVKINEETKLTAAKRANEICGIKDDLGSIPSWILEKNLKMRAQKLCELIAFEKRCDIDDYFLVKRPIVRSIRSVENSGVYTIVPRNIQHFDKSKNIFINSCRKNARRFVHDQLAIVDTMFSSKRTATERIRTYSGMNFMSIPASARDHIISRFHGSAGKIAVLDFDSMDLRSMIASTEDEKLHELYDNTYDFHLRTMDLINGHWSRDEIKLGTYQWLYGGMDVDRDLIDAISEPLRPLGDLRDLLWVVYHGSGVHPSPTGNIIKLRGDHPGAVLGNFAQTVSSHIFQHSLVAACDMLLKIESVPIFFVHDELVIDVCPGDFDQVVDIATLMSNALDFPMYVKIGIGQNYKEAKERIRK